MHTNARPDSLLRFGHRPRLPILMQVEAAECGLICLAMVAGYHGLETDLTRLRQKHSVSIRGTNLRQIIGIAEKLDLSSRALRLEPQDLGSLQVPCILHWDMNHFVVLRSVGQKSITIHDPACGIRRLTMEQVRQHFTGVALELVPTSDFKPGGERRKLKLSHFWTRIVGLKRAVAHVIALALLLQLFAIGAPFYLQTVIDDVIVRGDRELLQVLAFGFALLLCIEVLTYWLREQVILQLSSRLNIQMAVQLMAHLVRLPMAYFYKRHVGDVISRFGALSNVRQILTTGLVATVVDGALALITLGVMFAYSPALACIVTAFAVIYATLRVALIHLQKAATEESVFAAAKQDSHFIETVRALQTIKLFQREADRVGHWQNALADTLNAGIRVARLAIVGGVVQKAMFGIENLVVVYFAANYVMANVLTVGMIYAFFSYKLRFTDSVGNVINQWVNWRMLDVQLERLGDIAHEVPEPRAVEHVRDQMVPHGAPMSPRIEVVGLGFAYASDEEPVFRDVSFSVEPGEVVVIVGASGCGKTTLLKCLAGLLRPTEGRVLIDGVPLERAGGYRSQIGVVMQEERLLTGSIAENIAFFESNADMEHVRRCARIARIDQEIAAMPMEYNTLVGDMGSTLSGGQRQRLVLARALYRRPRILLLDEATSNLDIDTEAGVNDQIRNLNITRLLISHRPETIRLATRVVQMGAEGATPMLQRALGANVTNFGDRTRLEAG